jgi:hypothetical protein
MRWKAPRRLRKVRFRRFWTAGGGRELEEPEVGQRRCTVRWKLADVGNLVKARGGELCDFVQIRQPPDEWSPDVGLCQARVGWLVLEVDPGESIRRWLGRGTWLDYCPTLFGLRRPQTCSVMDFVLQTIPQNLEPIFPCPATPAETAEVLVDVDFRMLHCQMNQHNLQYHEVTVIA